MIHRIYRTQADLDALATAPRVDNGIANTFDYSGVVVKKPWGSEYLYAQNHWVAAWFLTIDVDKSTSLHCHERKRTCLVVRHGIVQCSTLDSVWELRAGDAIIFEAGVFHSTRCISARSAEVVEAETPPLKGDLIRLRDDFGRVGQGYEQPEAKRDLYEPHELPTTQVQHAMNLLDITAPR